VNREREAREFWDAVAADWRIQVGMEGDMNRRLVSDPVLRELLGDVAGKRVLDAGCGTGYLSRQLADRGAVVTGVDFSDAMIEIARADHPELDFRRESVATLASVDDASFDAVVANYVLMDVADLDGAVAAFHRVLRPGGMAVVVFSHPCFPQSRRTDRHDGGLTYDWDFAYFEERRVVDPPWGHFEREFPWYHRPLSRYWAAFNDAGFRVDAFREPRLDPGRHADVDPEMARKLAVRPYSVAFRLRK
jgi:ubiquinone/menaquinone biosynthesis C-methylase UbiE